MVKRVAVRPGSVYYGWVLVVTLAATETTSWGVLYYAFTVFLKPMQQEFGWSRGAMTGAFSIALAISGLAGVPAGRWLDRRGPRALMTAGSCVAALLVLALASVPNLLVFYLLWAAIGVTMAAVLYEPAFVVVATWFVRYRSRALTVLTFLAGFASVVYIPLAGWLVESRGWRPALVMLAVILALGTIPLHALVLRRRPQDLGLLPDGEMVPSSEFGVRSSGHNEVTSTRNSQQSVTVNGAVRGVTFWLLTVAFFLSTLGVGVVFVHLVPYLTDHGYSEGFAARAVGLVGIMALPGRLVLTPLGDRMPRSFVAAMIFSLQVLALLMLLLVHGAVGVFGFVVLFGAGFGAVTPARAALVAEFYGPAHYGSISGLMAFFLTGARAAGPVGAGVAFDLSGSYEPLLWGLVIVSAVAALAVLLAERSAARAHLIGGVPAGSTG